MWGFREAGEYSSSYKEGGQPSEIWDPVTVLVSKNERFDLQFQASGQETQNVFQNQLL